MDVPWKEIRAQLVLKARQVLRDHYPLLPFMLGDNAATVAVGSSVAFPRSNVTSTGITAVNDTQFNLVSVGTYQIFFQVTINEPGQLVIALNGTPLAYTVVGRATGTSQLVGMSFVTTTTVNSTISIMNPPGNLTALTVTPISGDSVPYLQLLWLHVWPKKMDCYQWSCHNTRSAFDHNWPADIPLFHLPLATWTWSYPKSPFCGR